jgi:hypothetical protein
MEAAHNFEGADLYSISNNKSPAATVSFNGLGNFANYGIRNMITVGSDMYIGTANPFNLLTDPNDTFYNGKLGGWELYDFTSVNK